MTDSDFQNSQEILVRLWGMDADGRAFFQNAMAGELNRGGALLTNIEHPLKVEEILGVQYGGHKSRVRVINVGAAVLPGKMQARVQILDGQPCPWENHLRHESSEPHADSRAIAGNDGNKRRFPRVKVAFPLELRDERGGASSMQTRSADISGRGCYVESLVPLPIGTRLSVTFWIDEDKIAIGGIIRSSDPGVGMGIEFTGLNEESKIRLQKHLQKLAGESDPQENQASSEEPDSSPSEA